MEILHGGLVRDAAPAPVVDKEIRSISRRAAGVGNNLQDRFLFHLRLRSTNDPATVIERDIPSRNEILERAASKDKKRKAVNRLDIPLLGEKLPVEINIVAGLAGTMILPTRETMPVNKTRERGVMIIPERRTHDRTATRIQLRKELLDKLHGRIVEDFILHALVDYFRITRHQYRSFLETRTKSEIVLTTFFKHLRELRLRYLFFNKEFYMFVIF